MGIIILLLITVALFGFISYFIQYSTDLDSKQENIIKDGLITELLHKMVKEAYKVEVFKNKIVVGRFEIKQTADGFWFPYCVYKTALPYHERQTDDDWGKEIGYVRWLSKDWKLIKELFKQNKKPIEQTQRQKLNLDK